MGYKCDICAVGHILAFGAADEKKKRKPTFSCNNVRILNHDFLIAFAILIKNQPKTWKKEKPIVKMKTEILLYSLFLVVFYSCNPNDLSDVLGSYWYKSDLLQQGIKGKVKTISYNSGLTNSYNESGFLTLVTSYFDSISYEYNASGQLLSNQ